MKMLGAILTILIVVGIPSIPAHATSVSGGDAYIVEEKKEIKNEQTDLLSDPELSVEDETSDQYNIDLVPVVQAIDQARNDVVHTQLFCAFMLAGVSAACVIWGVKIR